MCKKPVSAWACSVGWVAWGWAWGVQVLGVLVISYERVRCMGRPLQGVLAPRTAIFLAGAAWLCGGVVGVTMGKGLQCSLVSRGQPGVAVGVLAGALLPVVLLGGLWTHGIRKLRRASTSVQTGTGSSFCFTGDNASRWRLPPPRPSHNLEVNQFCL
ncbi:uncharacterized protein LOC135091224 [Scylla paramamosain]|uniref:uncharacterized protein LOC135091224 n=1 Tax=Scylla paramamosain TaxID=85552 RepID=UPI003083325C